MKTTNLPMISVVIPVKPGGEVKALTSIRMLEYPCDRLEISIAEGYSPSRQRNEAVRQSKGEIVYFLDDDASPDKMNLKRLSEHFSDPEVAVAGGPSIAPAEDSFIQHCFNSIFISPFGGAGIRNRYQQVGQVRLSSDKELIMCNLGMRRDVFLEAGGLNEKLYPNEENELMTKIKQKGLKLIHDPNLFVFRSQRKNLSAFVRQLLNYGRGRMEQTILSPNSFSLTHFIPLLFLIYCFCLFVFAYPPFFVPMAAYLILNTLFSLMAVKDEKGGPILKIKKFFVMNFLFPLMHLSYGGGMFWGLTRILGKKGPDQRDIGIRKVTIS